MAIEILKRLIITLENKHVKFETDKCHLIGSGKRHKLPMTKSGNEKKSNQKSCSQTISFLKLSIHNFFANFHIRI